MKELQIDFLDDDIKSINLLWMYDYPLVGDLIEIPERYNLSYYTGVYDLVLVKERKWLPIKGQCRKPKLVLTVELIKN